MFRESYSLDPWRAPAPKLAPAASCGDRSREASRIGAASRFDIDSPQHPRRRAGTQSTIDGEDWHFVSTENHWSWLEHVDAEVGATSASTFASGFMQPRSPWLRQLEVNPSLRPSAVCLLGHPWLLENMNAASAHAFSFEEGNAAVAVPAVRNCFVNLIILIPSYPRSCTLFLL